MTNDLKALGLALIAVFALGAVAAPAASATDHVFTSNSATGKTDLTGESVEPAFSLAGVTFTCAKGTYAGTVEGNEVEEIAVHPEYDGPCELSAGLGKATVRTNGCDYLLTGKTHTIIEEETVEGEHATVHVVCTDPEESIEIEALNGGIVTHIGDQRPLDGVHYTNLNTETEPDEQEPAEVTIEATIEEITYSCTGGFCGLLEGGGSGTDGFYEDDVTVTGYKDTGDFDLDPETHTWTGSHGEQVHISVSPGT